MKQRRAEDLRAFVKNLSRGLDFHLRGSRGGHDSDGAAGHQVEKAEADTVSSENAKSE